MKKTYLLFLSFFFFLQVMSAQKWFRTYPWGEGYGIVGLEATDNHYLLGLNFDFSNQISPVSGRVLKVTEYGETIWTYALADSSNLINIVNSDNDTYIFHEDRMGIHKLSQNGNLLWSFEGNVHKVEPDDNGGVVFTEAINGERYFRRLDSDGDLTNSVPLGSEILTLNFYKDIENGGYQFIQRVVDDLEVKWVDDTGVVINSTTFSLEEMLVDIGGATPLLRRAYVDGNDLIVFFQVEISNNVFSLYQAKINSLGQLVSNSLLFDDAYYLFNLNVNKTGSRFNLSFCDLYRTYFLETNLEGVIQWLNIFERESTNYRMSNSIVLSSNNILTVGSLWSRPIAMVLDSTGYLYDNEINGFVGVDENQNCQIDNGEDLLEGWRVLAEKGNEQLIGQTNSLGFYNIEVDTGMYNVKLIPPVNVWEPCEEHVVNFSSSPTDTTLDFSMTALVDCPVMMVNLVTTNLRPCAARQGIVEYCNIGSETAINTYIDIRVDPEIEVLAENAFYVDLGGNVYRFFLGNVDVFECGDFTVAFHLDCDANVGDTYCIEAHAYLNELCFENPDWSGALLDVKGSCQNDTINFRIENVGEADMLQPSEYIIVEDAILRNMDEVQLLEGESEFVTIVGNGSTFSLVAQQVENAPFDMTVAAVVDGCGSDTITNFSFGFADLFPLNDPTPFMDTDCPIAVNSFDPNDKKGFPVGYGNEHYIEPETPIEYRIRFQNTGTDTAYTVIVRDTLSSDLDWSTLQLGAASHDYDFYMTPRGELAFVFPEINLLDSATNLLASEGMLEFKIYPKADTPLETVITNQAAIYFDYNEPIYTNETYHTIGRDFIEVIVSTTEHPTIENIEVQVFPNPFQTETTMKILNYNGGELILEIFDATGKRVSYEKSTGNEITLKRRSLKAGIYFYKLLSLDGLKSTGTVVVQ